MRQDPAVEWQRLSEHYQSLNDEELRELALDTADLTATAQQVLRDEMKRRGLREESAPAMLTQSAVAHDEGSYWDHDFYRAPPARGDDDEQITDGAVEFTWKTPLCECNTEEQVQELGEALRSAGIESWVERRRGRDTRISVAADQLEQARVIASQPIPAEIVAEVKKNAEDGPADFEMPTCPKCGASDPLLVGVNPVNQWRCGACGEAWADRETAEPAGSGR